MKQNINAILYQGIIENKWIDISYINKEKVETNYYIGIIDINEKNGAIHCDIFNSYKDNNIDNLDTYIRIDRIKKARILNQSFYPSSHLIKSRLEKDKKLIDFLEINKVDNNILNYLVDCYHLDTDPYLKETIVLDGIDSLNNLKYKLDDRKFNLILDSVFKKNKFEADKINRYCTLAMNVFSIDISGKQYVVAYRELGLDFKTKTLTIAEHNTINKSFLIDDKRVSLSSYLDMDQEVFCSSFDENKEELIRLIEENYHNKEKTNTRANIFLISRNITQGVESTVESIFMMEKENKLTQPLKSFFGRNRAGTGSNKSPKIVIFDKNKINFDQMRVVYNSMVNHVTYVKGPPGTGKTETIFNVLLSAYVNDKTVLVCSNNNHPINDILAKMRNSLKFKSSYNQKEENIFFPIIRIGNNSEMEKTIENLREILDFVKNNKVFINENLTLKSKEKMNGNFEKIREMLQNYEEKIEIQEKIDKLSKIKEFAEVPAIYEQIDKQLEIYKNKNKIKEEVSDDDFSKYCISANNNLDFLNFIYFSSLAKLKKLLHPSMKELKDIIENDVMDEAILKLNKYLKDDSNLKKFLNVFPMVVCTNLSSNKLGNSTPYFDICIMDEAGQCNIASSLIPIIRANKLLLIGDTNQLQPVTVIESWIHKKLINKYDIKPEYDYVNNSILSTMLNKDKNSKVILLRYHYRCGRKISEFVNQRFYEKQLKLFNKNEGSLSYIDVKNTFNPNARNSYIEEAKAIVELVKNNNYHDVGIITPFNKQAALINRILKSNNIFDVSAGTIHNLQGSEKSVIIMSSAISIKTAKRTMDWIKNNHELINVGITRAKDKFVFVCDKEALDLICKNEESDIKVLSDYVFSNGEIVVPKSDITISTDFSNNSENEKEFFKTIKPYFNKFGKKMKIERNVLLKKAIKNILPSDYVRIGLKEFDVVVQVKGMLEKEYKTILAFEIDGGEHIGSRIISLRDRDKENICRKYQIKLIRIANSQVKDYELIIKLFESVIKKIPDIENINEQLSLFEFE